MDSQRGTSPVTNRDFRLLFGGSSISMVGDQFTLVALPWLVLQLTGNPAQLGLVLAVMALPRAALMLIGGAVVDRMSAHRRGTVAHDTRVALPDAAESAGDSRAVGGDLETD